MLNLGLLPRLSSGEPLRPRLGEPFRVIRCGALAIKIQGGLYKLLAEKLIRTP